MKKLNILIPMAGDGSRFPKDQYLPKPLIDINGKPMVVRAIESLGIEGQFHFVIRKSSYSDRIKEAIANTVNNPKFFEINSITQGPACSALLFRNEINNDTELVIANCDQIMEWNPSLFFHNVRLYDGGFVTYYNNTDNNSYAKLDRLGNVIQVREKEVISCISLNGIHYWKRGSYFVQSTEEMIAANDRAPNGEFYIAPSFNYMIKLGLSVGIYHIPNEQHHAVGLPSDLQRYLQHENFQLK
jgi:NDP-sugar pyrophosphorylase family protein